MAILNVSWNVGTLSSRFPESEAAYRKALELDPDFVYAWHNLGIALNVNAVIQKPKPHVAKLWNLTLNMFMLGIIWATRLMIKAVIQKPKQLS